MKDPINSNYTPTSPSYSLLPSVDALTKYGVAKSTALYIQNNHWIIPREYRDLFPTYYLLRWEAAYFLDRMVEGTITRESDDPYITYQVIYYRCNPAAIKADKSQLLLSFRELQEEYKSSPVVLVTVA